ncbi:MAG: hypothetical protein KGZ54_08175 [Dethiobacter sp.]|nr:hypothetical protein [Dethiobacter sp.]MBS3901976.1 hypothetical protein [Dethiobacter sp.]
MVNWQRGYALLLLVFATLLVFLLGSTIFLIALSDLRVSLHLAEADRAFYYAEAGVELLKANLPRSYSEMQGFRLQLEKLDSPRFSGSVSPLTGENYAFLLTATGQAGNKRREAAAEARYFPFGGSAVFAGNFLAAGANVKGSVYADYFLVGEGETVISGDLALKELRNMGGSYLCLGREWQREGARLSWSDFDCLTAKAKTEGWPMPPIVNDSYRLEDELGRWYVPGDLLLDVRLGGDLLVAVAGDVTMSSLPAGRVVLFAQGEIVLQACGVANVWDSQSLVLYSQERITVAGDCLLLRGVLLAPVVELQGASLLYCHRAALPWLELVPADLLALSPTYALEWLETRIRR